MYRLKKPDLPEPTLQASARATESILQPSARSFLKTSEEVMTKYPGDEPEQNLRQSVFTDQFKKDLKYWQKKDPEKLKRIRKLIEDIQHHPFEGIGKPEHLKYMGADVWSRRINDKHRIVYFVSPDQIDFLQARFHYTNN
ncbi:Txe/YoeB family addiction module toxin [Microcoleus sp. D2_18a_D3]|uniref:Txe/YoeB family addiction module toxin n=1 Tax=Microcoleus sp. D2_18a_D3 TaxID=3055330 RepID=UPI002FD10FED